MKRQLVFFSILSILIIGLYSAGELVLEELKTGDGCPKIMHIPMCIVILICFLIPFIAHLLKKWTLLYFICTGLAGSIALFASVLQFIGKAECPKTASGTPMCYYSLLFFSSLMLLKIIEIKLSRTK